jgi:hypothetical protein
MNHIQDPETNDPEIPNDDAMLSYVDLPAYDNFSHLEEDWITPPDITGVPEASFPLE